jgi:hypothetical protein
MRNKFVGFVVLVIGLVMSAPLFAHHGAASFDTGKKVVLKGTVKEWLYPPSRMRPVIARILLSPAIRLR